MKTYPLFKVHVDRISALRGIDDVFKSGFINEGDEVVRLTRAMELELRSTNVVLMNSCTSALTLALHLAGVGPTDEVVSTPMTCVATNVPILTAHANVAWADVDPRTGMVTPQTIDDAITYRTRAVIVVAWAGTPPDMRGIQEVCAKRGVWLILDAAHAYDAGFADEAVHTWADMTCYSFQAIKHFTTGDGGALVCSRAEQHAQAKALKWFGLDRDVAKDEKGNWRGQQWDVDIENCGYKFNMNNVAAAIGLSQLEHIDNILGGHRSNADVYDGLFDGIKSVQHVDRHPEAFSSHWVYTMIVDPNYSRLTRDQLLKALNAEGINAGVVHVPNDEYTAFEAYRRPLPGVRAFSAHQFSIPCGWWLTDDDVRHIASRVIELSR